MRTPILLSLVFVGACSTAFAGPLHEWPPVASLPAVYPVASPEHPGFPGLPDPLRFFDHVAGHPFGEWVGDTLAWREQRRPEILDMLRHYMFGHEPPAPEDPVFVIQSVDPDYFDGLATKKVIQGFYGPPETRALTLNLYVPNERSGPVPVLAALNAQGNELIEPGGSRANRWDLPGTLAAGIALATAAVADFAPDSNSSFRNSVIQAYAQDGFTGDWRTLAAWAWGLARMVDYLEADPDIDPHRIALTGYSRRGKAALWAAALDERVALVAPHQTGTGGAHPTRNTWGWAPTFRTQFPHWFRIAFNTISTSPNDYFRLPFDQHFAVAAVAPRSVLLSENNSYGAGFNGLLAIQRGAQPVWNLFGLDPASALVLEWNRTSGHSFVPEHWAVLHAAVQALPPGGRDAFRAWALDQGVLDAAASEAAVDVALASDLDGDGQSALEEFLLGLSPHAADRASISVRVDADGRNRIRFLQRRDGVGMPGAGFRWRGVGQWIESASHPQGPWTALPAEALRGVAVEPGPNAQTEWITVADLRERPGTPVFYRLRTGFVERSPVTLLEDPPPPPVDETLVVRVNFQAAEIPLPMGWVRSAGELFGERANGFSYGWRSPPGTTRQRNNVNSPSLMHDTLTHTNHAVWEIALPPGAYDVRVVAGDPSFTDSTHSFLLQGEPILAGTPTASARWIEGRGVVSVDEDGLLTLSSGPGASNNKICFIEIRLAE
jgi:hypothetical protein